MPYIVKTELIIWSIRNNIYRLLTLLEQGRISDITPNWVTGNNNTNYKTRRQENTKDRTYKERYNTRKTKTYLTP